MAPTSNTACCIYRSSWPVCAPISCGWIVSIDWRSMVTDDENHRRSTIEEFHFLETVWLFTWRENRLEYHFLYIESSFTSLRWLSKNIFRFHPNAAQALLSPLSTNLLADQIFSLSVIWTIPKRLFDLLPMDSRGLSLNSWTDENESDTRVSSLHLI